MTHINLLYANMTDQILEQLEPIRLATIMNSFKDMNMDPQYFKSNAFKSYEIQSQDERIAMTFICALGDTSSVEKYYPELILESFKVAFEKWSKWKTFGQVLESLNRDDMGEFIEFVRDNIDIDPETEINNYIWEEILTCGVVYSMNTESIKRILNARRDEPSLFETLKSII